jgi:septum formation inhibitor MinC
VKALGEYGIRVVGVTNTPPILEDEAVQQLGLPSFMSKGRVLDRQSTTLKFRVEDVVKVIVTKTEETAANEMINPEVYNTPASDDNVSHVTIELEHNDAPLNGASTWADKSGDDATSTLPTPEGGTHGERDAPLNGPTTLPDKSDDKDDDATSVFPTPEGGTHVYHGSVRSGQQVAAKQNQSLIIIGSVNSGGEVLSDRDIFVFGKLRGRALAGLASANGSARIFSTSFDPELICIGDTFTTVDAVTELGLHRPGEAAMVSLDSRRELAFEHIPL